MTGVAPRWGPRRPPLAAVAVAGRGAVGAALARAALAQAGRSADDPEGAPDGDPLPLRAHATGDLLIVCADPGAALPWADGATFLGVDPAAPGLLLPIHRAPDLPAALLAAAVARGAPAGAGPFALLPDDGLIVALGPPRPLRAADLRAFAEGR